MGLPLFVYFHGHDATVSGRSLIYRLSYSRMGRFASGVFVPSDYFAKRVAGVGIPERKICVIPYGVDADAFLPGSKRDPRLVVAVGRFVEKKAPHLTVQAFAEVVRACPDARLEMVGSGPLLTTCQKAAINLGIAEKVVFHGSREHDFVRQLVRQASVFVQHSVTATNGDTESLGVSLLEAMASEVPVVVTRHNGFVETVVHGETGFLVDEYDVSAMAQRIVELLQDPAAVDRMGRASRARVVARYSPDIAARKLRNAMGLAELDVLHTDARV
jgi:glycosyltransferase involved in cell wall biosynthesis